MNIHTAHIEHVLLLLICTILTVANSRLYKSMKGIHWFSLYNAFALISAICIALRGNIPQFVSIVGGNVCVVMAYSFLFLSLARRFGTRRFHLWLQGSILLATVFTMVEWGFLHPDTRLRLIAFSSVLCLQQTHIVFFILRRKNAEMRHVAIALAMVVGALALTNMIRMWGVFAFGAPSDYLKAGEFLAWIVMINSSLQCGAVVSYVWMTAALLQNDLHHKATTDPLTGVLNRRALEQAAETLMTTCARSQAPLSAIFVDLDKFKVINDHFGHHRGDETLIAVAQALAGGIRKGDVLARVGGDEFSIVLPFTSLKSAAILVEELRARLNRLQIGSPKPTGITASFGLAETIGGHLTWDQLMANCDRGLYTAKELGGNSASLVADTQTTEIYEASATLLPSAG